MPDEHTAVPEELATGDEYLSHLAIGLFGKDLHLVILSVERSFARVHLYVTVSRLRSCRLDA